MPSKVDTSCFTINSRHCINTTIFFFSCDYYDWCLERNGILFEIQILNEKYVRDYVRFRSYLFMEIKFLFVFIWENCQKFLKVWRFTISTTVATSTLLQTPHIGSDLSHHKRNTHGHLKWIAAISDGSWSCQVNDVIKWLVIIVSTPSDEWRKSGTNWWKLLNQPFGGGGFRVCFELCVDANWRWLKTNASIG